jgi:hypothetical protein
MQTTKPSEHSSEAQRQMRAERRALEAVQEALDRRDNGGDAATATEN